VSTSVGAIPPNGVGPMSARQKRMAGDVAFSRPAGHGRNEGLEMLVHLFVVPMPVAAKTTALRFRYRSPAPADERGENLGLAIAGRL
jgi:hypothetical protein